MARARTAPLCGALCFVMGALACGCVISPQPEPPTIDADRVGIELMSTNPDSTEIDTVVVNGEPGAVTPGGAVLHAVNLDRNE